MFFENYLLKQKLGKFSYFIWNSQKKTIQSLSNFKPLDLKLIIGVDKQKEILLENTINFTKGNFTNNALLINSFAGSFK